MRNSKKSGTLSTIGARTESTIVLSVVRLSSYALETLTPHSKMITNNQMVGAESFDGDSTVNHDHNDGEQLESIGNVPGSNQ